MVRVFVVYQGEVDAARYEQHAALCRKVPGATFRYGPVTRTLFGDPLHLYAEFEFPDQDAFRAATQTDEFKATGADAADMGVPHSVYVAEVS